MAGQCTDFPVRNERFTRLIFPRLSLTSYGARWISSDGEVVTDIIGTNEGLLVEIDGVDYGTYPLTDDTWSCVCNALTTATFKHPKWHF